MVRKYRIMMITEEQLRQIHEKPEEYEPEYEGKHRLRWETMRRIAVAYFDKTHELNGSIANAFMTVARPPDYEDDVRPPRNSLLTKEFSADSCASPR